MFQEYETYVAVWRKRGVKMSHLEVANECLSKYGIHTPDGLRGSIEAMAFEGRPAPNFKVWPDIARTLSSCDFRINGSDVKWPFESFVVSLPEQLYEDCDDAEYHVRNVLVYVNKTQIICFSQRDIIEGRTYKPTGITAFSIDLDRPLEPQIVEHCKDPTIRMLKHEHPQSSTMTGEFLSSHTLGWFRICIGVALLATSGDKAVEPDVLSKDLQRYIDAKRSGDEQRAKSLADRCERRRGQKCFAVGRDSVRQLYGRQNSEEFGDGRELSFQHLRRAHFRKHQSGRVVFIRHTIVRPDLPSKVGEVTYNIR